MLLVSIEVHSSFHGKLEHPRENRPSSIVQPGADAFLRETRRENSTVNIGSIMTEGLMHFVRNSAEELHSIHRVA